MTYKELMSESYAFKLYENLKSSMALYNQVPIQIIRIDNTTTATYLIIKQALYGLNKISTRKLTIDKSDIVFMDSWLANDFPNVEIQFKKNTLKEVI